MFLKKSNFLFKKILNLFLFRGLIFSLVLFYIPLFFCVRPSKGIEPVTTVETVRVVIDPGHGGASLKNIKGELINSERWDPVTQQFLSPFNYGMKTKKYDEHIVVLRLAKKVYYYLNMTRTEKGWKKFKEFLNTFATTSTGEDFKRLIFETKLTRKNSWNHLYAYPHRHVVNKRYRMFDYPNKEGKIARARKKEKKVAILRRYPLQKGRLSLINDFKAPLVVSLHMTPGSSDIKGGMSAVLSPGYETFEMIRRIHLYRDRKALSRWKRSPWRNKFLVSDLSWSQYELARSDAWTYFNGFPTNKEGTAPFDIVKKNRGIRYNLIDWSYADKSKWAENIDYNKKGPYTLDYKKFRARGAFWDRERSLQESWRREKGHLGYGGDNHYASDELLRFIQYGARLLSKDFRGEDGPGPIHQPYVSAYTLPIYVNAIVAYLEVGHLNKELDRKLIIKNMDLVAKSIAVGIYSLFRGLKLREQENIFKPKGEALNLKKYIEHKDGNYFELSSKKSGVK